LVTLQSPLCERAASHGIDCESTPIGGQCSPPIDSYGPLFAIDQRHGAVLWEMWIEGFE
jgi:hypothetical protein